MSVYLAFEFYVITFAVALVIAGLIKGMLAAIRHITPKKEAASEEK